MPEDYNQIRLILSRYLDGDLDEAGREEVNRLIAENPLYAKILAELKTVGSSLQQPIAGDAPDLWDRIAGRLAEDAAQPVGDYDFEFVSAYYDNEIAADERETFEAQLYRNDSANRMLGDIDILSLALKGYGQRLEAACTVDVAAGVMAAHDAERGAESRPAELPEASAMAEMMSAYLDRELSSKDTIAANRLIENELEHQEVLQGFSRLQQALHSHSARLQEQAPDLWPAVSERLVAEENVVSLAEKRKATAPTITRIARLGVPAAAAAVLLLVLAPAGLTPDEQPAFAPQGDAYEISEAARAVNRRELASLPPAAPGVMRTSYFSDAARGLPDAGVGAVPLSSEDLVSSDLLQADMPGEIPSSEEYLFEVLDARIVDTAPPVVGQNSRSE